MNAIPRVGRLLQPRLELSHVAVGVAESLGLAQPDAVDDARVVQGIGDDRVLVIEQCLEHTTVGVEARREQNRVFLAEPAREPLL